MTNAEYHRYAALFDAVVASDGLVHLELFADAVATQALREWSRMREREPGFRVASRPEDGRIVTWGIVEVRLGGAYIKVHLPDDPATEAA